MENDFVLIVLKWVHLMATIAWIGGMFTNFFVYLPAIGKVLDPPTTGKLMAAVMKRFKVVVYTSMALFLLTGMISAAIHFTDDAIVVAGNWNTILAIKVVVFALLVISALYAFEILAPKVAKIASKGPSPKLKKIQKTQMLFAMFGFIMGLIIVTLSAAM